MKSKRSVVFQPFENFIKKEKYLVKDRQERKKLKKKAKNLNL